VDAVAAARGAGLDVELDLYGSGPAAPALEARITRLGLGGRVRLLGTRTHDELRRRLPEYHAGLVPTRLNVMTRYSLSTKLLEYVHLGMPLIAPRIPTYLEYFPEKCVWYFEPNDAAAAARAIAAFAAATPELRIERARAAQAAAGGLRWEDDAAKLRALYEELLAGSQPR
jgi:glycosyltransferase involved in cell wall biosynthesis